MDRAGPDAFSVTTPEGWTTLPPTPGTSMILSEPERGDGDFRSAVTLVFERMAPELDLETYASTRLDALAPLLTDAVVIDEQLATLGGRPAVMATIAYRQGELGLTLRQWAALQDGLGVLMGAVCSNDRFGGLVGTFGEIVESLVLDPEPS